MYYYILCIPDAIFFSPSMCLFTITNEFPVITKVKAGDVVNRQTSSESASLPQYDEGTESANPNNPVVILRSRWSLHQRLDASLKKSVKPEIVNRYDLWVLRHKIGGAKVFVNNVQRSDQMM